MNVLFRSYSTMTQEEGLQRYLSALPRLLLYDEFESAEALAIWTYMSLLTLSLKKGKNRFPDPDAVAKAIQKAARKVLTVYKNGK